MPPDQSQERGPSQEGTACVQLDVPTSILCCEAQPHVVAAQFVLVWKDLLFGLHLHFCVSTMIAVQHRS